MKYANNCTLLFTDTDSFCYAVATRDMYCDMAEDEQLFDTSDYDKSHFLFSNNNKKVIGKMKDETKGIPIEEFVGLRSKMYSIKCGGLKKQMRTAKGIKKSIVRNKLRHDNYKSILFDKSYCKNVMHLIRNDGHEMYSIKQNKTSLSCYDDKRYILHDGYTTFAYGHCQL